MLLLSDRDSKSRVNIKTAKHYWSASCVFVVNSVSYNVEITCVET